MPRKCPECGFDLRERDGVTMECLVCTGGGEGGYAKRSRPTPSPSIPKPPWEDMDSSLGDLLNKLTHYEPAMWPVEREAARAELQAIRTRLAEAERERDDARLMLRSALDYRVWGYTGDSPPASTQWLAQNGSPRLIRSVLNPKAPFFIQGFGVLADDGTGLPILDDAARVALGRAK